MLMTLPDELLLSVVKYFAPTPNEQSLYFYFRPVSPDIINLSVVSRRWRRICLPMLFASIQFKGQESEKFRDFCMSNPVISGLVKSIHPLQFADFGRRKSSILCRTLLCLKNLTCIDLSNVEISFDILRAMLEHPTVATVRICSRTSLPVHSLQLDLSKVVLDFVGFSQRNPDHALGPHLHRGLRVTTVNLWNFELSDGFARLANFSGLQQVVLRDSDSASCQGLHNLTSALPHLNEIWLINTALDANLIFALRSSFTEDLDKQNLTKCIRVTKIGLARRPNQDWRIQSLEIFTTLASYSLIKILSLVASHFPTIEILSLDLEFHSDTYLVDDLVAVLRKFPRIDTLNFSHIFHRLMFTNKEQQCWEPSRPLIRHSFLEKDVVNIEAGLVWFISHLAKELDGLEASYIEEEGICSSDEITENGPDLKWDMRGWLHVRDGSREIDNRLFIQLPDDDEDSRSTSDDEFYRSSSEDEDSYFSSDDEDFYASSEDEDSRNSSDDE
ncbi:hypothetical protein D9757_003328 [Collybiopsis confluens]|uniref:F-box domain-containing protein n=1 Tax=Collybiopsis confluens TaxID=2823264 RepID=A0A8H5MFS4_9AGAR|nr:hypothetical protein D9757_003328 [Collybiopsis confluens]